MRNFLLMTFLAITLSFTITGQNSQGHSLVVSVPRIALINIEGAGSNGIGFIAKEPATAGHSISFTNSEVSEIWLNYSSTIGRNKIKQKVLATLSGDVPEAISLYVEAGNFLGNGKGTMGQSTGRQVLSETPVEIISHIGNCFTGKGINNGHLLTYTVELDETSFHTLASENYQNILVIYTISE
jgi:hypothetical protein